MKYLLASDEFVSLFLIHLHVPTTVLPEHFVILVRHLLHLYFYSTLFISNQMETESITPFHKLYKKHAHSDDGRVSMLRQVWSDIEKDLLGGQKMQGYHLILMALKSLI